MTFPLIERWSEVGNGEQERGKEYGYVWDCHTPLTTEHNTYIVQSMQILFVYSVCVLCICIC